MTDRIDVTLVPPAEGEDPEVFVCRIETFDRELWGHDARFSVTVEVDVRDSRAINETSTLFEHDLRLGSIPEDVAIPRSALRAYSYSGQMIDLRVRTRVHVDDAILFDTKVVEEHNLEIGDKPRVSTDAESVIEPVDAFDFFKNLKAIPPDARARTLAAGAIGAVIVLVNTLIGVHDQVSPEAATWLYSHFDSDGDGSSPFFKSLVGSGATGVAVWLFMRGQLRRYMDFSLRTLSRVERGRRYSIRDLVKGRSRVPLVGATLRVVACNMELGQYRRGSGTDERTVSFREPVRGVILYEQTVDRLPARVPIAEHFEGEVDFDPMFRSLFPPFTTSSSHGLDVHWEVQLLHPEFVDQELVGPRDHFSYEDFLDP